MCSPRFKTSRLSGDLIGDGKTDTMSFFPLAARAICRSSVPSLLLFAATNTLQNLVRLVNAEEFDSNSLQLRAGLFRAIEEVLPKALA